MGREQPTSGVLTSPNYPQRYLHNLDLVQLIQVPEGNAISKMSGRNTPRQIDSIWVYLNEFEQTRLPEGLEKKGSFVLKPGKRPIVFRTFMEGAGTHAIAIGFFPE